jgi:hypothetical protein
VDTKIPNDHPVRELGEDELVGAKDPAQCGTCGRWWDDGIVTGWTPTPSGRCPFEYWHFDPPVSRHGKFNPNTHRFQVSFRAGIPGELTLWSDVKDAAEWEGVTAAEFTREALRQRLAGKNQPTVS